MEGDDFTPEGGKLPEFKLGPCGRARHTVLGFFRSVGSLIPLVLSYFFLWLDRCEASAGFHLLLQEAAAGALPRFHLSGPQFWATILESLFCWLIYFPFFFLFGLAGSPGRSSLRPQGK